MTNRIVAACLDEVAVYQACSRSNTTIEELMELIEKTPVKMLNRRSYHQTNSLLHHIINCAAQQAENTKLDKKECDEHTPEESKPVVDWIPLIYKLALVGGEMNAQNDKGNTALHLAALNSPCVKLIEHLLRLGCDPTTLNGNGVNAWHMYSKRDCFLLKPVQPIPNCGIWHAVSIEDIGQVEKLLQAWTRVHIRKDKTLIYRAEETGNDQLLSLLKAYEVRNELVCAAFALDEAKVKEILLDRNVNFPNLLENSYHVPKPLTVALAELGPITTNMINVLRSRGFNGAQEYKDRMDEKEREFEECNFHKFLMEGTTESLQQAWAEISSPQFDVQLRSKMDSTKGYTFLHLVCEQCKTAESHLKRYYIRIIYRLALEGIDVNARDEIKQETAVHKAYMDDDQELAYHILRTGADGGIPDAQSQTFVIETYAYKGKLVKTRKTKHKHIVGLWAGVEDADKRRVERWLNTWCRVQAKRNERSLTDYAKSLGNEEIVAMLKEKNHTNEFVSATLGCDFAKVKLLCALGKTICKVNPIDPNFLVGYTHELRAEHVPRPFLVVAIEISTPEIVEFLIRFGADLSLQYEAEYPCGPTAFWAFREHILNEVTLVVAKHADITLRDETGATLLHRAVLKKDTEGKEEIIETLLARKLDIAARDCEGLTARDYLDHYKVENADFYRSIIDSRCIHIALREPLHELEKLVLGKSAKVLTRRIRIVENYDHILDLRGPPKNRTLLEEAYLKKLKDVEALLLQTSTIQKEIHMLHRAAEEGDLPTLSKHAEDTIAVYGKDNAGRTILHKAVLHEDVAMVIFIMNQINGLLNEPDSLGRTPVHYAAAQKDRKVWCVLSAKHAGADLIRKDVHNLSVRDYVREMETKTHVLDKPKGRQFADYKVREMILKEWNSKLGKCSRMFEAYERVSKAVKSWELEEIKNAFKDERYSGPYTVEKINLELLKQCLENTRENMAIKLWRSGLRSDRLPEEMRRTICEERHGTPSRTKHFCADEENYTDGVQQLAKEIVQISRERKAIDFLEEIAKQINQMAKEKEE